MREFFVANAGYWIDEFHLDGLRLDATQSIYDASPEHILAAIGRAARAAAAGGRRSSSSPRTSRRTRGWCARRSRAATASTRSGTTTSTTRAMVALTGRNEAYYTDYRGTPQELISAVKYGYLYQGQRYSLAEASGAARRRSDLPPAAFVTFLQNHDQVANSARGERLPPADQPRPLPGA